MSRGLERSDHCETDRPTADNQGDRIGVEPGLFDGMQPHGEGLGQGGLFCPEAIGYRQDQAFAQEHSFSKSARKAVGKTERLITAGRHGHRHADDAGSRLEGL